MTLNLLLYLGAGIKGTDDRPHALGCANRRKTGNSSPDDQNLWQVESLPAAVIWPVKNRPKCWAASTTAR